MNKKIYNIINKLSNTISPYYLGVALYFTAFICCVCCPALSYWGYLWLSRFSFLYALILTVFANLFLMISSNRVSGSTNFQMCVCHGIIVIAYSSILIRNIIVNSSNCGIYPWIGYFILCGDFLFWIFLMQKKKRHSIAFLRRENLWLYILCVFVFCLCIEQITKNIRWDSITYYAYIENIKNFLLKPSDIIYLKASGHLSYGYILLYAIGQSLYPQDAYGIRIETILFYIICVLFLNKLLEKLLPNGNKNVRKFTVVLFAFTPVILGPIHNIDVELLIVLLTILLFYFYLTSNYILGMLTATLLVFTKETSVLLVFSFLLGDIISTLIASRKREKTIIFTTRNFFRWFSLYLPLLFFLLHYSMGHAWWTSISDENVDKFNAWGINKIVIINKLRQLFIMNFAWIPTAIIVITIFFCLWKIGKKKTIVHMNMRCQLICMYSVYLFTQLFFITYVFPRYIKLHYFFVAIMLQWALNQFNEQKHIRVYICTWTIILTLIQNFYSLDIISNKIFGTINVGKRNITVNSPIVYLNNTTILKEDDAAFMIFSPYGDINRQWSYFDVLINNFLKEIDYNQNDLVIYPDDFAPRSYNVYFGMWNNTYYNRKTQRLIQNISSNIGNNSNLIYYNAIIDTGDNLSLEKFDRVYYLEFPYSTSFSMKNIHNYNTINTIEINYRGWILKAHEIKAN